MYIISRSKKPTIYLRDDGVYVCTGSGVEVEGNSMRGAYTSWRNRKALLEMPADMRAAKFKPGAPSMAPMFLK